MMQRLFNFNQAIRARAKSYDSPLYNSHPELTVRQPIMRISSDEETQGAGSNPDGYRDYERNTWVRKAANKIADNLAPYLPQVVKGAGMDATPLPNHPLSVLLLNPNAAVELMRSQKLVQDEIYGRFKDRLAEVGAMGELDALRALAARQQAHQQPAPPAPADQTATTDIDAC